MFAALRVELRGIRTSCNIHRMAPRASKKTGRLVPLIGHRSLKAQWAGAVGRQALPASLLFQGPRGIGKQRLALWLARLLLCERAGLDPCDECTQCRFSAKLTH